MIVYPNMSRKGLEERIEPEQLVDAVFLMASRAKEAGCKTVFFPEVGALEAYDLLIDPNELKNLL